MIDKTGFTSHTNDSTDHMTPEVQQAYVETQLLSATIALMLDQMKVKGSIGVAALANLLNSSIKTTINKTANPDDAIPKLIKDIIGMVMADVATIEVKVLKNSADMSDEKVYSDN